MPTYCYILSVDGQERTLAPAEHGSAADAIDHGRTLLKVALEDASPESAYVAVFEDEGADDEPLGAWDWSREAPEIVWSAAE